MTKEKLLTQLEHVRCWSMLIVALLSIFVITSWNPLEETFALSAPSDRASNEQGTRNEITFQLSNNGFSPAEVNHAPGTFAIAVQNSGLSGEYTLRLSAADGTLLYEVHVQKGSTAWTVNLQTGSYTLSEREHPQWTCRIVVQ